MCKLTIHTATYNRAYILGNAYESLKKQTNQSFEWIITDDGSTDGTAELVQKWMNEEHEFKIFYNPLPHVGIPRALNSGVAYAHTPWFMMLDSDDMIVPETVEKVLKWLGDISQDSMLGGIGFAKCHPDGQYMKNQTPKIDAGSYVDATNIERSLYGIDMDMCEVHRTALFRKYPFQYWESEKYAPEQLNYNQIAMAGYKLRWHADKLYICDYLPDGQTRDDKIVKHNPMGFAMMYNQNLLIHTTFSQRFRDAMQMTALCSYAGHLEYLKESNSTAATILSLPLGLMLGIRRRYQYKKLG